MRTDQKQTSKTKWTSFYFQELQPLAVVDEVSLPATGASKALRWQLQLQKSLKPQCNQRHRHLRMYLWVESETIAKALALPKTLTVAKDIQNIWTLPPTNTHEDPHQGANPRDSRGGQPGELQSPWLHQETEEDCWGFPVPQRQCYQPQVHRGAEAWLDQVLAREKAEHQQLRGYWLPPEWNLHQYREALWGCGVAEAK